MIKDPTLPRLTGKEEQQIAALMRGQKTEYRLRQRAILIGRLVEQHRTVAEVPQNSRSAPKPSANGTIAFLRRGCRA